MQEKSALVKKFGKSDKDTGQTEVQVAILSEKIKHLTEHFKVHAKDHHGRRGLLQVVGKRRSLLNYLKKNHSDRYLKLINKLDLRS